MPRYSVWALRAAMLHLLIGFTIGALLLTHKGLPYFPQVWSLLPLHIETLLVGWTLQLIMGVGFWVLPRFKNAPKRGREELFLLAVVCLNLGVAVVGGAAFFTSSSWLPLAGRLLEAAACLAFAWHAWPRVKASGT